MKLARRCDRIDDVDGATDNIISSRYRAVGQCGREGADFECMVDVFKVTQRGSSGPVCKPAALSSGRGQGCEELAAVKQGKSSQETNP